MIEHASWQYMLIHCCGSGEQLGHVNYIALSSHIITIKRPPTLSEWSGNCSADTQETAANFWKGDMKISCQVS